MTFKGGVLLYFFPKVYLLYFAIFCYTFSKSIFFQKYIFTKVYFAILFLKVYKYICMNSGNNIELTRLFAQQLEIVNDIYNNLECDLYVSFSGDEEECLKIRKKLAKLRKIKTQLILLYSSLVSEF